MEWWNDGITTQTIRILIFLPNIPIFQYSNIPLLILFQPLPESHRTQCDHQPAQKRQGQHLGPQDFKPHPFQKGPPDDDKKISQGIDICKILKPLRHILQRESKAGKNKRRIHEEEGGDLGLLLSR